MRRTRARRPSQPLHVRRAISSAGRHRRPWRVADAREVRAQHGASVRRTARRPPVPLADGWSHGPSRSSGTPVSWRNDRGSVSPGRRSMGHRSRCLGEVSFRPCPERPRHRGDALAPLRPAGGALGSAVAAPFGGKPGSCSRRRHSTAIVRVTMSTTCGSDLHFIDGYIPTTRARDARASRPPLVGARGHTFCSCGGLILEVVPTP